MISVVFTQTTNSSDLTDLVAAYGPFAPFAVLLLIILQVLWKELKVKDAKIEALTEASMNEVIPLVLEATQILGDAVEAIKQAEAGQPDADRIVHAFGRLEQEVQNLRQRLENHDRERTR